MPGGRDEKTQHFTQIGCQPARFSAQCRDRRERLLEGQQKYFFNGIADPDCNFGLNPSWVRFYPYQLQAKAGSTSPLELRVRNYRSHPMHLEAAVILPAGWKASPEVMDLTIPAGKDGSAKFSVSIPDVWDRARPRVALAADVRADG